MDTATGFKETAIIKGMERPYMIRYRR